MCLSKKLIMALLAITISSNVIAAGKTDTANVQFINNTNDVCNITKYRHSDSKEPLFGYLWSDGTDTLASKESMLTQFYLANGLTTSCHRQLTIKCGDRKANMQITSCLEFVQKGIYVLEDKGSLNIQTEINDNDISIEIN